MISTAEQGSWRRRAQLVLCFAALVPLACQSSSSSKDQQGDGGGPEGDGGADLDGDADGDGGADGGSDGDVDQQAIDEFFSIERIHAVEITLDADAHAALVVVPKEYVEGTVIIDGVEYEEVGVRLKGSVGSFVPLEDDGKDYYKGNNAPGKSAFIIDFNRFVKGQNHLGLKKITVNNMVQDPSGLHEFLGYTLFRAAGVPASRSGWAEVSLNGEGKGLYALIETPDNDEFLNEWFGHNDGNLYEGDNGSDLTADRYMLFDQDSGGDTSFVDLFELTAALEALESDDEIIDVLEAHFGVDEFLAFVAAELYLGHWDGYAWSPNNYALHHDTEGLSWSFVPWGIDQLFHAESMGNHAGVMKSPGPSWEPGSFGLSSWMKGGRLQQLCYASGKCRKRLGEKIDEVIDLAEEIDLAGLAAEARALIEPTLVAETTAHGDPGITLWELDGVEFYLMDHPATVREWLPCLTAGGSVDHDNDSSDGCTADCNDYDPLVYPGAEERCNVSDDDCDGVLDNDDQCDQCLEMEGPAGLVYAFCFAPMQWEDARAACQGRGMELVSIHSWEEWEFATFVGMTYVGAVEQWYGLNDTDEEGVFAWSDGSTVDFEYWVDGYPQTGAAAEVSDCVQNLFVGWIDIPCDTERAFVCRQGS